MFGNIVKGIKNAPSALAVAAKVNEPKLWMAAGTITFIGACAGFVIQARKLDAVLDEHNARLDKIHEIKRKAEEAKDEPVLKEIGKDTALAYVKTGVSVARLLVVPVSIAIASQFCYFKAFNVLNGRLVATTALAAAATAEANKYKEGAQALLGSDGEKMIRHGLHEQSIKKEVINEDGTVEEIEEKVMVADPAAAGQHTKFFTRSNPNWDKSPDALRWFFERQQYTANQMLRQAGPKGLVINEVFKLLGFEPTVAGMVDGYIYDPKVTTKIVFDITRTKIMNEAGHMEDAYVFDFHTDGNIYEILSRDLQKNSRAS